jgi:hypothetical protein
MLLVLIIVDCSVWAIRGRSVPVPDQTVACEALVKALLALLKLILYIYQSTKYNPVTNIIQWPQPLPLGRERTRYPRGRSTVRSTRHISGI